MSLRTLMKAFGLVIGVTAGAAVMASPAARADALDSIVKQGVLKVAVPQDFPPFGSVGIDMKPQGYDIDAAALIAKDLGVKLELVPVSSSNRIPYLTTGKADLIISSLGKNAEREKVIDFSVAYAPFFNGVFGPPDVKADGPAALDGRKVGVTRGSVEDIELSKIVGDKVTVNRYEDNNGTISAFLSGQVELVATGNVVAAAILARNPPRKPEMKFLIKNSPCFVGLNKGETALLERVNAAITKAKADGSLNRIAEKWLKAPLPADL
ncbi:polar amino acid transport system substrate-binding protein [Azospirillum fermentarium]|uniref:transporter substrate-binding domain-containing protein n=1 Tax=Azospirillum fermentarium TaxID=1233114 RepID=UPI002226BC71|nr:transporter substrate-binding domain-containing protein [Azospirillum fermentarium]MCW2248472.1 polar amino acid transport system substrate-binding protein [Azospirillum fermentarium]